MLRGRSLRRGLPGARRASLRVRRAHRSRLTSDALGASPLFLSCLALVLLVRDLLEPFDRRPVEGLLDCDVNHGPRGPRILRTRELSAGPNCGVHLAARIRSTISGVAGPEATCPPFHGSGSSSPAVLDVGPWTRLRCWSRKGAVK